jgi:hypothetical protein
MITRAPVNGGFPRSRRLDCSESDVLVAKTEMSIVEITSGSRFTDVGMTVL